MGPPSLYSQKSCESERPGLSNRTLPVRTLKLERVAKRTEDEIWFALAGRALALSHRGH